MPRIRYIITYTLCGCVREMEVEGSENKWEQTTIDDYCGYPDCPKGQQSHYGSSYYGSSYYGSSYYGSYGGGSSRRSRR
ncbi:hypothetical protein MAPG_06826 [Magnaporthiopsis poae ATCC 64411]|uniref:Uncharacterized protein n=1 Tax=Magnaporthiopsis poae (strain ATCC 64411 / 73-15) TaxID=644358 RepID=A0A0C4E334_MAGP6|nr:hypothetical protein MAPG_06826 [Magnaporthiopsis poae ATCC 64411]